MKRFSFILVLHIILLAISAVGCYLLIEKSLLFSSIAMAVIFILTACNLYRLQLKQTAMMKRMIDSLRHKDTVQTFSLPFRNKLMEELANELTQTMNEIRSQLVGEEIKHQYYKNLLEKVDTVVLVTNHDGKIEWMNQAGEQLLGPIPFLPEELLDTAKKKKEVVRLHHNNQSLEMAVYATLFTTNGKERLIFSLKNIHSVLEHNEMEAWQKLIRVLTHEIMNSITPIISLSETLSERSITEQVNKKEYDQMLQAMQTIHRRSKGLLSFVENYRKLTRISAPERTTFSVSIFFDDMKKLFPKPFIHFITPPVEARLFADRSQIEQLLINLIKNAIEATQTISDPEIRILYKKEKKESIIEIADNGEGILPDVIDKIFVPFFTTKPSGSGIGLSLCKQIMSLHEGSISVCSYKDKGCSFILRFP